MANQVPRYIVVREKILDAVRRDDFLHNGRLPSEETLAKMFAVSRSTIRSALQSLESEGIVEKKHGDGNFINLDANIKPGQNRNASFFMPYYVSKLKPNVSEYTVERIKLTADMAEKVDAEVGEEALEVLKRINSGDIEMLCMHECIPMKYIPFYVESKKVPESIYSFFSMHSDIVIKEIVSDITPCLADETPFYNVEGAVIVLDETFMDTEQRRVAHSYYYMNPKAVRPKVIRDRPPEYWGAK